MIQIQKPYPGNEKYHITTCGKVISYCRGKTRMLMLTETQWGYITVKIYSISPQSRTRRVHQLVLETFVGPCPEGHVAHHKNGIKTDNRLANLEWTTISENALAYHRKGRHVIKTNAGPPQQWF